MLNKSAFSLTEVIVASVIFLASAAGIFAVMGSLGRHSAVQSTDDVKGAFYGQRFLDSLRSEVTSSRWGAQDSALYPGMGKSLPAYAEFNGYSGTYDVEEIDGARKVTLHITTPDH